MKGKLRLALLVVLVIGAAAACSSRRNRRANLYPPVKIHVENLNFYDATVYAVWRSDRRRLGVVNGNGRQSFSSDWIGPDVTLEIELLAGRRYRSDTIGVSPGDDVILEIPASNVDRLRIYRRRP
jgi:hypothetical protein